MELEQAIITTSGDSPQSPNLLVARSKNIDDRLTEQLLQSSPGRNSLEFGQRQAIYFFQPTHDCYALARSVVGPMDLQMQRQIITRMVLIGPANLARFYNNGVLLSHYLRSSGKLILDNDPPALLPPIALPNQTMVRLVQQPRLERELEVVLKSFHLHRQIALLGANRPVAFLGALIHALPIAQRCDVSFSIGLRASESLPFRVRMFHDHDDQLSRELAQQQIRPIPMHQIAQQARAMAL